jgi:hypothetical protein
MSTTDFMKASLVLVGYFGFIATAIFSTVA